LKTVYVNVVDLIQISYLLQCQSAFSSATTLHCAAGTIPATVLAPFFRIMPSISTMFVLGNYRDIFETLLNTDSGSSCPFPNLDGISVSYPPDDMKRFIVGRLLSRCSVKRVTIRRWRNRWDQLVDDKAWLNQHVVLSFDPGYRSPTWVYNDD
jgi:hypothetical protein